MLCMLLLHFGLNSGSSTLIYVGKSRTGMPHPAPKNYEIRHGHHDQNFAAFWNPSCASRTSLPSTPCVWGCWEQRLLAQAHCCGAETLDNKEAITAITLIVIEAPRVPGVSPQLKISALGFWTDPGRILLLGAAQTTLPGVSKILLATWPVRTAQKVIHMSPVQTSVPGILQRLHGIPVRTAKGSESSQPHTAVAKLLRQPWAVTGILLAMWHGHLADFRELA